MKRTRKDKKEKFKAFNIARKTGKSNFYVEEENDIYDEVDENTYNELKRKEMINDDFIVDDNGEGYLYDSNEDSCEFEKDLFEKEKNSKKRCQKNQEEEKNKSRSIISFFKPSTSVSVGERLKTEIDDIIDDFQTLVFDYTEPKVKFDCLNENLIKKRERNVLVTSKDVKTFENLSILEDDLIDPKNQSSKAEVKLNLQTKDDGGANEVSDFKNINKTTIEEITQENIVPKQFKKSGNKIDEFGLVNNYEHKNVQMFWYDYSEIGNSLLLYGKILTIDGVAVTAVVQLHGIYREFFFIPRKYKYVNNKEEKSEKVKIEDVYNEVIPLIKEKYEISEIVAETVIQKYVFQNLDIPREIECLKVRLCGTKQNKNLIIPSNLEGLTFKYVFGGNTGMFESFVLQKDIMGPCWLSIKNANFDELQNISHCEIEISVENIEFINKINYNQPSMPKMTILSLSIMTAMNFEKNEQEIICISASVFKDKIITQVENFKLEPDEKITYIRPFKTTTLPPGLQKLASNKNFNLKICSNEENLLNNFSFLLEKVDPDIYIGHRLESISFEILLHRMHKLNILKWSTIGKRNRKLWPEKFNRGSSFFNGFQIRELFEGRLLCDIANDLGQSLTTNCQTWNLDEMYKNICHKDINLSEISIESGNCFEDVSFLFMILKENSMVTEIIFEIGFTLQILNLSKQLTTIAGNSWSHTLSGKRSGGNEYILLHEFYKNGFLIPDKVTPINRNQNLNFKGVSETETNKPLVSENNRKPKYQGGLVFEPDKGLHTNYVLVMDFNSLYPSIIQEFNICFTTIELNEPNIKLSIANLNQGILPKILNLLVFRRNEVKKLLNNSKISENEKNQYDIIQKALKLTANSMYGCLGYLNSRFYAKELAVLVTTKGREVLMNTKSLVDSIGLKVIYGDTDSLMIDTGKNNYKETLEVAQKFKTLINEQYKFLKIDTESIYKRILLHSKKKYAALRVSFDQNNKNEKYDIEIKGLDMKRREYCQLSKEVSLFVLNKILSDSDSDTEFNEIYDYISNIREEIDQNKIHFSKYQINTKLSKDPEKYNKGNFMPQVNVALHLRKEGKIIKSGSVITYIICAPLNENDKRSTAERAVSVNFFLKDPNLKPDPIYYLEKQIFSPIERLVEKIEKIDIVRIAEKLGLDKKRYVQKYKSINLSDIQSVVLDSNISDDERFASSQYFFLKCICDKLFPFGGFLAHNDCTISEKGVSCSSCNYLFPTFKIAFQLEYTIRKHISLYYDGWLVCDDPACAKKTRLISVYGKRCVSFLEKNELCNGLMSYLYPEKFLYNQLLYLLSIFDPEKTKKMTLRLIHDSDLLLSLKKLSQSEIISFTDLNIDLFRNCQLVVNKYLSISARRFVNMASIFS